ncbi:MAG: helix-turn-helix domain-containing protein [Oscillospiraceae bacterium]|nr:helix-turn-helix domain-containing protein [Oscillospiraceae bacterium]MBR2636573.1 helix-turn-helix domain-containing protein [Oscillospiraceae bacterium]
MNADFPRILTLLRKEKGISQKAAASDLGISQALLSHYEKGIRECGLDFLVRTADYYGVSCDYLLGRSPDRSGMTLTVEDIPEPDAAGKENVMRGSILPVLNKKLIANSLNILFDLLQKSRNKTLINEVSSFLMLSVYRMFRVVYSANPKNQNAMFTIPRQVAGSYADAAMTVAEAKARAVALGETLSDQEELTEVENLAVTTESLNQAYPMFASSLLNLIQNSESKIGPGK